MSRAASRTLGLFACSLACSLACEPGAPPNAPLPSASAPVATAAPGASRGAAPQQAWSIKEGESIADERVPSFVEACAAGKLDDATTAALVQRLDAARDRRGEPCFVRALQDYRPDVTEETVTLAANAAAALELSSARGPLFEVWKKIHASKPKSHKAYRAVADAMDALRDPGWEPQLIAALSRPVDASVPSSVMDEMYWQISAAKILGAMKSQDAIKPLIKLVLSPPKAAGQLTAILALVKIGRPTIGPTVALLKGDDKDLASYSRAEQIKAANGDKAAEKGADTAHIGTAALILATLGREETAAPLLDALAKADDGSRAIIARELTKVPKTAATLKAFQDAFEKTPLPLTLPGTGAGAREALLESSTRFFDASLVPWLVKTAKQSKGDESDVAPIREASLIAAMKLATPDQWKLVDELADQRVTFAKKPTTVGKGFEKERKLAKELLATCGAKVDCYLDKLADPASQAAETQFVGIKSAYMVGVLGSAASKPKLLAAMPKLTNVAVRFVAVSLLDFFSPQGDPAMAKGLQQILSDAERSGDIEAMRLNGPFPTVIYRLNARAE